MNGWEGFSLDKMLSLCAGKFCVRNRFREIGGENLGTTSKS